MEKEDIGKISYKKLRGKEQLFAEEVTVLMVLKGTVLVEEKGENYSLEVGDIYLLNMNSFLTMQATVYSSSTLVLLTFDSLFFASQFPKFYTTLFECHPGLSEKGKKEEIGTLRKKIAEVCLNEFSQTDEKRIQYTVGMTQLLLYFIQYFQKGPRQASIGIENQKLKQLLEYIEAHYYSGLTLKEVADVFYMSESTLSKYFKKETGEYFSEFIKKLQIRHSLPDLLYSKKSVEQIAQENGFNSGKIYREQFKRIFSMSPTDYRKERIKEQLKRHEHHSVMSIKKVNRKEIVVILYTFIQTTHEEYVSPNLSVRSKRLFIEPASEVKQKENPAIMIHIGSLGALNDRKVQQEIRQLKKQRMITHVSFYEMFEKMESMYFVAKQAQMNSYPLFSELDTALAFIEEENLQVMFHLSLTSYQKERESMVYETFFAHIRNQFGEQELARWSIDVQFSPTAIHQSYSFYQELKEKVKQISSSVAVGVELTLSDPYDEVMAIQAFTELTHTLQNQFDFLTYTVEPNFVFQTEDESLTNLMTYHQYVQQKALFIHSLMKEAHIQVPIYLSEWNTLTGTTINMNGLFFRGALILQDILLIEELVDGLGFWINVEQFEKNKTHSSTKNEGLELFHFYSSRRPSFFCLLFAQRMKGTIIAQGDSYLLTQSGKNYQLLVWNSNYFDPHLSSEQAFLESQALRLDVTIQQLISGNYQIKQLELNRNSGALFYTYNEFQEAKMLDYETQEYVRTVTQPKIKVFDAVIHEQFTFYLTLDTNAVTLLELTAQL